MITAISDGWIFTPAPGATSDQPDYDYLHYGVWLKKTTDEGRHHLRRGRDLRRFVD